MAEDNWLHDDLNFEGEQLCILLKPGHYDTLYHSRFLKMCEMAEIPFPQQSDMAQLYPEKGPEIDLEEEIKAQERKNVREGERRRKSGSMRRLHCNAERTTAAA